MAAAKSASTPSNGSAGVDVKEEIQVFNVIACMKLFETSPNSGFIQTINQLFPKETTLNRDGVQLLHFLDFKCNLYGSGMLISVGESSIQKAESNIQKALQMIQTITGELQPTPKMRIRNIAAAVTIPFKIYIERLQKVQPHNALGESLIRAARLHFGHDSKAISDGKEDTGPVVVMVFPTGRVNLVGLQSESEMYTLWNQTVKPLLLKYTGPSPTERLKKRKKVAPQVPGASVSGVAAGIASLKLSDS